jgi:uncharacterized membrane protein YoaK (UPF0700 family)
MGEFLLIIVFIAAVIMASILLKRVRQPINTYIRLTSGLLLLILVWFFANEGSLSLKIIMTVIVVSSAIKTTKDYLDFARQTKTRGK